MDAAASPATTPPDRLPALDGLRGIAALAVVMLHFDQLHGTRGLFAYGYLAVDFFFLLSGFVLTGPIEVRARPTRADDAWLFAARFLRFWPLMALGATIGAAAHLLRWPPELVFPLLALSVLGIPLNWGGVSFFSLNGPQWTLFIELVCNALHVFLLRHLRIPALLALSMGCAVVLAWTGRELGSLKLGTGYDEMLLGFLRAGFAYPLGIVLARSRALLDAWPRSGPWLAVGILIAAIVVPGLLDLPETTAETLICGLFVVVLVYGIRARVDAKTKASLTWLGALSFPLYAIHFPILETADIAARAAPPALAGPIYLGGLVLALVLANAISRTWLNGGIRLAWVTRPFAAMRTAALRDS